MWAFTIKHWIHVKSTIFLPLLKASVQSYSCTYIRNKSKCKSEFVWNVLKQVMLKAISFSIGLNSKHAWASWDSARIIDFEFPTLTRVKWTLSLIKFLTRCYLRANSRGPAMIPCMTCIYRECKAKYRMEWSYGKPYMNTCLHVLFLSWNNLLLPMEQMFYFSEYVTSLWLLWKSENFMSDLLNFP